MTEQQIEWASKHDWYKGRWGDVVFVQAPSEQSRMFGDFEKLLEWAGY